MCLILQRTGRMSFLILAERGKVKLFAGRQLPVFELIQRQDLV